MNKLEEMIPELADVLAAQESAMDNIVSILTKQVHQLMQTNDRQTRQLSTLEATQLQLQNALQVLQNESVSLRQQQQQSEQKSMETLDEVQAMQLRVQEHIGQIESQIEAFTGEQVKVLVTSYLHGMEEKMTSGIDERLVESSNQVYQHVHQMEESMQAHLDMLEKKFEYLSRVKMEIKDLTKKMDKHEQTIDDMRIGLEMVVKSIGTDESDGEEENNNTKQELSQTALPNDAYMVGRKPTLHSESIVTSEDAIASIEELPAPEIDIPPILVESVEVIDKPDSTLLPSNVFDNILQSEEILNNPRLQTYESDNEQQEPANYSSVAFEVQTPEPVSSESEFEPGDGTDDLQTETVVNTDIDPNIDEIDILNEPEPLHESISTEVIQPIPLVNEDETAEVPPSSSESVEDYLSIPSEGPIDVVVEEQTVITNHQAEEELAPSKHVSPRTDLLEPVVAAPVIEHVIDDDHHEEIQEEEVPDAYLSASRSRVLHQQKSQDENLEVFRPSSVRTHSPVAIHHSATISNFFSAQHTIATAITLDRSRREERNLKRQSDALRKSELPAEVAHIQETRVPLAREEIKTLWMRVFARLVQLKRLQILNGTNPEKALFRKQNMSVGARMRRLEDAMNDLEDAVTLHEGHISSNTQSVQAVDQAVAQIDSKSRKLDEAQQFQGKMIVSIEEKIELLELDIRRMRATSRQDTKQGLMVGANAFSAMSTQHQELAMRMNEHIAASEVISKQLNKVLTVELPALEKKIDYSTHDIRTQFEYKLKELTNGFSKSLEKIQATQIASDKAIIEKMTTFFDHIYRNLLNMSHAILLAAELSNAASLSSPSKEKRNRKFATPLEAGIELLQTSLACFKMDCKDFDGDDAESALAFIHDQSTGFQQELDKLKEQAEQSRASVLAVNNDLTSTASPSSSLERHLALTAAAYLQTLESLLNTHDYHDENSSLSVDVVFCIRDLVIQIRSTLFLLALHAQLLDSQQQLQILHVSDASMQEQLSSYGFAIAEMGSINAVVKLMNSRLDSFLDLTFSFAKDEDVKKSIQELQNSSSASCEQLAKQVETTNNAALKRDELLEQELTQLVSRVNKKLDKDELLWTHEVLERQLQSVAKASLGEDDLIEIHRLLRAKMDKAQLNALLHDRAQTMAFNNANGENGGAVSTSNTPLIGAKCISCNGELPPTKAMIKSVVKEEVHQEVIKSIKQQQQITSPSSSSFSASNHRHVEKYKKELLLAALQQKSNAKRGNHL